MADYTDNFNRADSATPSTGAPYTITSLNGTSIELKSNALHDLDTGAALDSFCRMEVDFQSFDHEVSVRLSTVTVSGATAVGAGPMISANTSAAVTCFFLIADFVAQTATILDIVSGVVTTAYGTSAALGAFAVGDVLTLGRYGSYIYAKKNGTTIIEARSNLYYTGKRGGVYFSRSGVGVDVAVDNWHAIDLIVPPPTPRAPGLIPQLGSGLQSFPQLPTSTSWSTGGTLQTDGTFTGTGQVTHRSAGTLQTDGTFTGAGNVTHRSAGTLQTDGTFTGAGKVTHRSAGTLATNGTFTGTGKVVHRSAGTLATDGTFTGAGKVVHRSAGTLATDGSFSTATGRIVHRSAGTLATGGTFTGTGLVGHKAAGTLQTDGTFTGDGVVTPAGGTTHQASGTLQTDGTFVGVGAGGTGGTVTEPQHGGLGRRGPYTPVEQMRHKQQLVREDDEMMVLL